MRANSLQFDQKEYAMTTILYREITSDGQHTEIIEEFSQLDLKKFAEACGQSPEWVLQLLEYDILPNRPDNRIHQFFGDDVSRARRAYRLQRDFDASFTAVAMMLDLIEEVQKLRREVKHLHLTDPVQTTQH
jgi:chaperone modulatory protein CbpM